MAAPWRHRKPNDIPCDFNKDKEYILKCIRQLQRNLHPVKLVIVPNDGMSNTVPLMGSWLK